MSREFEFPLGSRLAAIQSSFSSSERSEEMEKLRDFSFAMQQLSFVDASLSSMKESSTGTLLEGGHCAFASMATIFPDLIFASEALLVASDVYFREKMQSLAETLDWSIKSPSTSSEFHTLMSEKNCRGAIIFHQKELVKRVSYLDNPEFFDSEDFFIEDTMQPINSNPMDKMVATGHVASILPIPGKLIADFHEEVGFLLYDVVNHRQSEVGFIVLDSGDLAEVFATSRIDDDEREVFVFMQD